MEVISTGGSGDGHEFSDLATTVQNMGLGEEMALSWADQEKRARPSYNT